MVEAGCTKAAISLAGFLNPVYPVISMTDGKMKKSDGFLLADTGSESVLLMEGIFIMPILHPEKYFQTGEAVEAGQILGFMGDTGYGEEGMSGKFPSSSSSGNLHKSTGKRGTECKPLLCLTGNGKKVKIHY